MPDLTTAMRDESWFSGGCSAHLGGVRNQLAGWLTGRLPAPALRGGQTAAQDLLPAGFFCVQGPQSDAAVAAYLLSPTA